jgi:hypothetical protein
MMLETLSILIHANSKVGKSTLASTSPAPILALDAEGSWKFINARMIEWNPLTEAPPRWDPTCGWDVCHVTVRSWDVMTQVYQWLQSGQHNFRSLVVDSITEVQRRLKANLSGSEDMQRKDWNKLLYEMDTMIRGMRDLTMHPTTPIQVVVFVAETRLNKAGVKQVPTMQGQIGDSMPYWVDLCGYLYVQDVADANGQATGQKIRRLLTSPNDQFEAGERVQGRIPGILDNPNITQMLIDVYPSLQQQPVMQ